jgi:hypothetical protein
MASFFHSSNVGKNQLESLYQVYTDRKYYWVLPKQNHRFFDKTVQGNKVCLRFYIRYNVCSTALGCQLMDRIATKSQQHYYRFPMDWDYIHLLYYQPKVHCSGRSFENSNPY